MKMKFSHFAFASIFIVVLWNAIATSNIYERVRYIHTELVSEDYQKPIDSTIQVVDESVDIDSLDYRVDELIDKWWKKNEEHIYLIYTDSLGIVSVYMPSNVLKVLDVLDPEDTLGLYLLPDLNVYWLDSQYLEDIDGSVSVAELSKQIMAQRRGN